LRTAIERQDGVPSTPSYGAAALTFTIDVPGRTLTPSTSPGDGRIADIVGLGTYPPAGFDLNPEILVSPDGTFATTSGMDFNGSASSIGTNLWNGSGTLITAESGYAVGWIDAGHLLVNTYTSDHVQALYRACNVYSPTGQSTGPCGLTSQVSAFQGITSDTIYAVNLAEILSVSTGNVAWMSGDSATDFQCPSTGVELTSGVGAVAGGRVVFVSGTKILAQGY
jgi:hypothetical protein